MLFFLHAAGLLFVLVLSSSSVLASPSELRSAFKARSLARHRHEHYHQTFTKKAPLRYRSRRRQVKVVASEVQGFELQPTPPRLVHPNRFENTNTPILDGNYVPDNVNQISYSSVTVTTQDNSTNPVRLGRTAMSGDSRAVNPIVRQEIQGGGFTDLGGVLNFRIMSREPLNPMEEPSDSFMLESTPSIFNSSRPISQKMKRDAIQHLFEAASQPRQNNTVLGGPKAAATWNGQPSPFRPKVPYQPSMNSTHDYGDVLSKSLWFYQVQSI